MKIEVIGKRGLSGWLHVAVIVLMAAGAALLPALPWVVRWLLDAAGLTMAPAHALKLTVLIMYSDVAALFILWHARGILRSINRGQPFVSKNVRRIQAVAAACALLAAGYAAYGVALWVSYFGFAMMFAFGLAALILLIGAELLRAAIVFKEENDLTI